MNPELTYLEKKYPKEQLKSVNNQIYLKVFGHEKFFDRLKTFVTFGGLIGLFAISMNNKQYTEPIKPQTAAQSPYEEIYFNSPAEVPDVLIARSLPEKKEFYISENKYTKPTLPKSQIRGKHKY